MERLSLAFGVLAFTEMSALSRAWVAPLMLILAAAKAAAFADGPPADCALSGQRWLSSSTLVASLGDTALSGSVADVISLLQEADPTGISRSNREGWHSKFLETHDQPVLQHLRTCIKAAAKQYLQGEAGAATSGGATAVQVLSMWANTHHGEAYNVEHRHALPGTTGDNIASISGVYYAAVNGSSCAQLRICPRPQQLLSAPAEEQEGTDDAGCTEARDASRLEPATGVVVMFPATALHDVVAQNPLQSTDCASRISLAFNLAVRDNWRAGQSGKGRRPAYARAAAPRKTRRLASGREEYPCAYSR
eukprot:TRINITY_DN42041_c0_g1_i1.p1 TRINITY_DN42041_c0_g1~~TRINITY_DN42041_c0_g1_i1.p1  ORF type:complete len:307 (-),score=36.60 TRINITY_DN42041_c0_g1_i1:323-1243(-)